MKNITISADEETARWVRIEAAKQEMSVSRFLRELIRERRQKDGEYEQAMRRYLARERRPLRSDPSIPYPSREEIHDRGSFR